MRLYIKNTPQFLTVAQSRPPLLFFFLTETECSDTSDLSLSQRTLTQISVRWVTWNLTIHPIINTTKATDCDLTKLGLDVLWMKFIIFDGSVLNSQQGARDLNSSVSRPRLS